MFADSPKGGEEWNPCSVLQGRDYLLQTAKARKAKDTDAGVVPQGRLEEVVTEANLAKALLHVAKNKGAPGVDGESVDEVVAAAPRLLPRLMRDIVSGRYRPGDVRRVWIPKPGGRRGLGIPNVMDRWVQQAVHQVFVPVFEPSFHNSSHGFRSKRGAHTAIEEAKTHLLAGKHWVVNIDLSEFFDRVNHQRLLARLSGFIEDGRVLKLVHRMLKTNVVMPDGVKVPTENGTPQGGPLSPLLSNIVLDELDKELERRGLRFVRYADDCNVFVGSERAGQRVMASLTGFIEKRLRLEVNRKKSEVARPEDVHFLGFSLRPNGPNVEVHLSKRSFKRLFSKIRELTPRNWGGPLERCIGRVNKYVQGWSAYFRLCSEEGTKTMNGADARVRRRLRAIVIRQRGKPRYLFRHLRKRGAPLRAAKNTAWRSRGIWKRSNLPGMTLAYPNRWFKGRQVCFFDEWRRHNPVETASGQLLLGL